MSDHLDALDGKDLKSAGWTCMPIDNVEHDFVTPLLDHYIKDLAGRMAKQRHNKGSYAQTLRKGVRILESENMVNL